MTVELPITPETPDVYRLLTSLVVPRPIAWVSSRSAAGVDNLAPHSFFTIAGVAPPVVQFTSVGEKDTVRNVRATGAFVVHVVPAALQQACNVTATDYPPGDSEFDAAGLTRVPAVAVAASRVAEAPAALECRYVDEHRFGSCTVVFGEVVHVALADGVRAPDGLADLGVLDPIARLGRNDWATVGTVTSLARVPYSAVAPSSGRSVG